MKKTNKELRRISGSLFEVSRANEESELTFVEGYAAVWDSDSELISEDGKVFIERISPYAFTKALENLSSGGFDCVATFDHERKTLLARTKSQTLELSQDEKGLKFRFSIPNTQVGRDVAEMISRGDLSQCSFIARYVPSSIEMDRRDDGTLVRTISQFDAIRDVSLVIDPAYSATEVHEAIRGFAEFEEAEEKEKEAKRQLREEIESQKNMLNNLIEKYEVK